MSSPDGVRFHKGRVSVSKRVRGKYSWVEKRVTVPPDFPEGGVVLIPEEDFAKLTQDLQAGSCGSRREGGEVEDLVMNGVAAIVSALKARLAGRPPVRLAVAEVLEKGSIPLREFKKRLERDGVSLDHIMPFVKDVITIEGDYVAPTQPLAILLDVCSMVDPDCRKEVADILTQP